MSEKGRMGCVFAAIIPAVCSLSGCTEPEPAPGEEPVVADVILEYDAGNKSHAIADTMWGIFYEDINYAADGGLYPELVRNRSFEARTRDWNPTAQPTLNWQIGYGNTTVRGTAAGATASPQNPTNPYYLTVNVTESGYALANGGYGTIPISAGKTYNFYFYAKNSNYTGTIACKVETSGGAALTNEISVTLDSTSWKKYGPYTLNGSAAGSGLLTLRFAGTGSLDLDFVSLMPTDTWGYGDSKWPYGGLRKDLAEALRDLKPGFIRFPGGCIVEGLRRHNTHYNWKDTIGPPEERKENINLWGYMMSYGLGFHEYFQLCEDIGAEPVPVLYAGLVCQGGDRRDGQFEDDLTPGSAEMEQLVQDYLDLIEYANGDTSSQWGAKRAANGHALPFNIKKIGIGNENWDDAGKRANYWRNFAHIRQRVLAAYPNIKIITSTGPLDSGWINDTAWGQINEKYTDSIVDEHYYMAPSFFLTNTGRYDPPANPNGRYARNGVQIFVGEYAAHESNRANTWNSALCEAAYMTGLERNADIVTMASYAPLFARQGMTQWTPDMIWFDAEKIINLTPNYQIQKLYANNTGKHVLPPAQGEPDKTFVFQSTSIDGDKIYTKLVNPRQWARTVHLKYNGVAIESAKLIRGSAASPTDITASIGEESLTFSGNAVTLTLPAYSVAVIRIN